MSTRSNSRRVLLIVLVVMLTVVVGLAHYGGSLVEVLQRMHGG